MDHVTLKEAEHYVNDAGRFKNVSDERLYEGAAHQHRGANFVLGMHPFVNGL